MPKIITTEQLVEVPVAQEISNTVYVPLKSTAVFAPIEVKTLDALQNTSATNTELGYKLVKHLIELGMTVLVEGIGSATAVPENSWTALADRGLYDIRYITNGQFGGVVDGAVTCAETRGDCIYLADFAESTTSFDYSTTTVKGLATKKSSYIAYFTPWFKAKEEYELGTDIIPASFGVLFAVARAIKNGQPNWYAMAGTERGKIPELSEVAHDYSTAEIELLQGRVDDTTEYLGEFKGVAINTISYVRPFGYVVWGNRTGEDAGETATIDLKPTAFMNVRNCIATIKKALYNAGRKYAFEQNSEVLWTNYKAEITPILDEMRVTGGLFGYRFEKVATDRKATLKAKLTIVPIEAVEDFELNISVERDSTQVVESVN